MLNKLSQKSQDAIIEKFGSVKALYDEVYKLTNDNFNLLAEKPTGFAKQMNLNTSLIDKIEADLDSLNLGVDGRTITSSIASDHNDAVLKRINIK